MENEPKPVVTGYPVAEQPLYPAAGASVPAQATAYPYPPGPPAPYFSAIPPTSAPYYAPAAVQASNGNTIFLRRLIVISVAVFLVVGFSTFVLWLVLRPQLPVFAVSSASVSSFNVSTSLQLSADFNLSLSVRNPNKKMGIFYDKVTAAVLYRLETISETSLPPFYQGKRNSTVVPASFAAAAATFVDADVANGIAKERSSKGGAVVFQVRVIAWVMFKSGAWRTRRHLMRVFCDDVRIGIPNAGAAVGSLAGSPQPCKVYL